MPIDTPNWFDEDYYAQQKLAQMNTTGYLGRNDWTLDGYKAELARYNVTAYENFLACNQSTNPEDTNLSPNPLFNVQEYLLALARFANDSGYSAAGYPAGSWTAETAMRHMLDDFGVSPWEHFVNAGQYDLVNPSNQLDLAAWYSDLADALNDRVDQATGAAGWQGRTDWSAKELAQQCAIIGSNPIEQMADPDFDLGVIPMPVSENARVTADSDWNPWNALREIPVEPSQPAAPAQPAGALTNPGTGSGSALPASPSAPEQPAQPDYRPEPDSSGGEPAEIPGQTGDEQPGEDAGEGGADDTPGEDTPPAAEKPGENSGETGEGGGDPAQDLPGGNDDIEPPVVFAEEISLVRGQSSYKGSAGLNTLFKGDLDCDAGSFNINTVIDGGADSVNTLLLNLWSVDRERKAGSTSNIQNVELAVSESNYKNIDASAMQDVETWTVNGGPVEIKNIDNPECVINIKKLHAGGDVFYFKDGVQQAQNQFVTLNLGSAEGLAGGTAVVHSPTGDRTTLEEVNGITNLRLTGSEESGDSIYLNFEGLRNLVTEMGRDFAIDLHCNPETITGSGIFNLAELTRRTPEINAGPEGCKIDFGLANKGVYYFNLDQWPGYDKPTPQWANVQEIVFHGQILGFGATEGLRALEFTPVVDKDGEIFVTNGYYGPEKMATTIQLQSRGVSDFTLLQHVAKAESFVTIDGINRLDWTAEGSSESGAVKVFVEDATEVNIDATGVAKPFTIARLYNAPAATVNFRGGAAGSDVQDIAAAILDFEGGAGADSFNVVFSENVRLAGNGGKDSFQIKASGGQGVAVAEISGSADQDAFIVDLSGKQAAVVKIAGYNTGDSLTIANGALVDATHELPGQFDLEVPVTATDEGSFLYDSASGTAWGFAANAGQIAACIELAGVSLEAAQEAFGAA